MINTEQVDKSQPPPPPPSAVDGGPLPPLSAADVPAPSSPLTQGNNGNTARTVIIIVVPIVSAIILMVGICIILRLWKRKHKIPLPKIGGLVVGDATDEISIVETIQYDFDTIKVATNNFSSENKLGQGGFGAVCRV